MLIRSLIILLFLLYSAAFAQVQAAPPERNVLLIISDDQGLDAGCYGNKEVHTPHLDKLAAEGVRFTQGYAAVSSCSPSRAVLLTGMYNHANGQYGLAHAAHNQRTRPDVKTLPRILGEKGYHTGIIGKHHLATEESYPFHFRRDGKNRNPAALKQNMSEFLKVRENMPFFLVVGLGDTHRAGGTFPKAGDSSTSLPKVSDVNLPEFLTDLSEVRQDYREYLASVNNLDRCVAAVMDSLRENQAVESTLVIFLSDNGIPFPGAKTNLYDAGIHLPLIIRMPGAAVSGVAVDAMVSWIDIAPTILDWTGATAPARMHGRSVMTLLKNASESANAAGWDQVFASHTFHEIHMYYPMRALRTREFKLIWNLAHQLKYPQAGDIRNSPSWKAMESGSVDRVGKRTMKQYLERPEFELYDIVKDPGEFNNLAGNKKYARQLDDLKSELLKMMKRTKDPWLAGIEQDQ